MPKKSDSAPEDFANAEDRFKLSILNIEKRFVDLEMAISSLDERLKSGQVESIKELNQRVEDIEDLTLVEQAGLAELKKMMESAESKFEVAIGFNERFEKKIDQTLAEFEKKALDARNKVLEMTGKVSSLEELAKRTAEKVEEPAGLNEVKDRIELVEEQIAEIKTSPTVETVSPLEIGELRNNLQTLDKKLALLESAVGSLKASVDVDVRKAVEELKSSTGVGMDFEFIKTKLDSLRAALDVLGNKQTEAGFKAGELEEKVNILSADLKELPNRTFGEIKEARRGIDTAKVRIESIERVVNELTTNMQEVEKKAKGFESLERLTNLKKEVDERLRNFKFMEEEMSKLSNRVEVIYDSLDKRMMGIKNQERDIKRLSDGMADFAKSFEQIRIDMDARVEKKDIGKVLNAVEGKAKTVDEKLMEFVKDFEQIRIDMNSCVEKRELGKFLNTVEEKINSMRKDVEQIRGGPSVSSRDLELMKKALSELIKNTEDTRNELKSFKAHEAAEKKELPEGFKVVVSNLGLRMSELEKTLDLVRSSVNALYGRLETPAADAGFKELVDKFVFLESRLTAMESLLQKSRPIVLE